MAIEPRNTSVPANSIFGLAVIGTPTASTAGFWIEVPRIETDWSEISPVPAYTLYAKE